MDPLKSLTCLCALLPIRTPSTFGGVRALKGLCELTNQSSCVVGAALAPAAAAGANGSDPKGSGPWAGFDAALGVGPNAAAKGSLAELSNCSFEIDNQNMRLRFVPGGKGVLGTPRGRRRFETVLEGE